jgi:beta-N-acetylhexosaminidase
MGFDGVLIADDISMKALGGTIEDRVARTMAAGMDVTMICNASFEDRAKALEAAPKVSTQAAARLAEAERQRMAFDALDMAFGASDNDNGGREDLHRKLAEMLQQRKTG